MFMKHIFQMRRSGNPSPTRKRKRESPEDKLRAAEKRLQQVTAILDGPSVTRTNAQRDGLRQELLEAQQERRDALAAKANFALSETARRLGKATALRANEHLLTEKQKDEFRKELVAAQDGHNSIIKASQWG